MTAEGKLYDVIGLGGAALDLLGVVRHYPLLGEKTELIRLEQQGGGQAGTAMVTVARLGGRAAIMGTNGDDEAGRQILAGFRAENVDVSHLQTDPGSRSHVAYCFIQQDTGDRAIFFDRGNKRRLQPADLDRAFVTNCRCLLLDTHHWKAAVTAATWAREQSIPVVTDLERPTPENPTLLRLGTHHIMPEHYLLEYTAESDPERAAQKLLQECRPQALVVTRGALGSTAYAHGEKLHQPAYPIEPVVDTTGAGDVFHGAFAYGLTLGYDLPTNLEFAALVAALKCRALGGRAGIPRKEELRGRWRLPLP